MSGEFQDDYGSTQAESTAATDSSQGASVYGNQNGGAKSLVQNADDIQTPENQKAFIKKWLGKIYDTEEARKKRFKAESEDEDFAYGKQWDDGDGVMNGNKMTVNIIQSYLRSQVAQLYAKDPIVTATRRSTLDFKIWDGQLTTIQTVMQNAEPNPMAGFVPDPAAQQAASALLQDVNQGTQRRQMIDNVGKTLEVLFEYSLKEIHPNFKVQMKQAVLRSKTVGVGFAKVDFQRLMEPRPDVESQIADFTDRLSAIRAMSGDAQSGDMGEDDAESFELETAITLLKNQQQVILREGLVISFLRSRQLIIDLDCESLQGFLGAEWLAEKFYISVEKIKEVYGKDIMGGYTAYTLNKDGEYVETDGWQGGASSQNDPLGIYRRDQKYACMYQVYDKKTASFFVVIRGCDYFIVEPQDPPVFLDTFFPYVPLVFSRYEKQGEIYPVSEVRLLRHIQKEYNRSKEALRQHRIASAPLYGAGPGVFDESDQTNMTSHLPHDVIILEALGEGEKVNDKLQMILKHPIDPNVYETKSTFDDLTKVVGAQDASLGATSGVTATEASIANDSMRSTTSSDADDLDEFLSEVARLSGQVLLGEMSAQQVTQRVGPGAVWPELSREDIMNELMLDIKAGSSGKPNKSVKAATLERLTPLMLQVPGLSPKWLLEQALDCVDSNIDLTDAYIEDMPSILAQNHNVQMSTGDPQTDPNAQGNASSGSPAPSIPGKPSEPPGSKPLGADPNAPPPLRKPPTPGPKGFGGLRSSPGAMPPPNGPNPQAGV